MANSVVSETKTDAGTDAEAVADGLELGEPEVAPDAMSVPEALTVC